MKASGLLKTDIIILEDSLLEPNPTNKISPAEKVVKEKRRMSQNSLVIHCGSLPKVAISPVSIDY